MAKIIELDVETLKWARSHFARYYSEASIPPPPRLPRREFAAFPFATETMMRRHATLRDVGEFREFLRHEVPRHIYYSSAYYQLPAESSMSAKQWMGADVIFDLDADHLRGAETLDYAAQLELVKRRLLSLVDDFLARDFGVQPSDMSIVFSGGRGYHVHIRTPEFASLTSQDRRELVDYIMGAGFDPGRAIVARKEDVREGRVLGSSESGTVEEAGLSPRLHQLPDPDAPGWQGRTTRATLSTLRRWKEVGAPQVQRELVGLGIPRTRARRWAPILTDARAIDKVLDNGGLDAFTPVPPVEFLTAMVRGAAVEVQGETDAPVTTDVHRLIRLPGSLHGGTGFRVVPISRAALEEFNPFFDAPLRAEGRTPVRLRSNVDYPFPDGGLHGPADTVLEVPTPQALFLVLRGEAELRP